MSFALAASLTLLATNAHAAGEFSPTAAFAVARDPSGQRAAAIADALLRTRVSRSKTLRLIEPGRVLSGDPRTREEETLERARAAFADGRRAYDALSLDEAITRLAQAVNLFGQTGPLLGDVEELENTLVYLAAASTLRGAPDEGETTFIELLTIDPNHQIDGFPPAVMKVYEAALKKIEVAPVGGVEIYSTPPYAAVYLDGRFEGVTPLTLAEVTAGTHHLRIEKVGFTVHGAPIEIAPNQKITSQTRLRSMKGGEELRELTARGTEEVASDGMAGSLRTLTRLLSAETLIFASVTQSGSDATFIGGVFDAATGMRLVTERAVLSIASASFATELDQFVMRLIIAAERGATGAKIDGSSVPGGGGFGLSEGAGVRSGGSGKPGLAPGEMTGRPSDKTEIVKIDKDTSSETFLGWTLIGIGGAAAVTGVVFGVVASSFHSDYRNTSPLSVDFETIRANGKRMSLVADGCFAGAVLSAGVGFAFLLLAGDDEPTAEELIRNAPSASVRFEEGGALFTLETAWP